MKYETPAKRLQKLSDRPGRKPRLAALSSSSAVPDLKHHKEERNSLWPHEGGSVSKVSLSSTKNVHLFPAGVSHSCQHAEGRH